MAIVQPEGAIISIGTGEVSDMQYSPDGKRIYVARAGTVTAYDAASGVQTARWMVGTQLGAIDISADGRYLVATERTTGRVTNTGSTYAQDVFVHRLDLTTGSRKTYTAQAQSGDGHFIDVSFLPGNSVLLTQTYAGSGWLPLTTLDLSTGAFSASAMRFSQDGTLTATPDKTHVAFLPSNISDAPVYVYTAGEGITATHDGYDDGVMGYNGGVQAINNAGTMIVQGVGLNVYDGNLNWQTSLAQRYNFLWSITGLAFSPAGDKLFLLDPNSQSVLVMKTADWSVLGAYPVGSEVSASAHYGDSLKVSPDGSHLAVIGEVSVQLIDLTRAINDGGTTGNDVLTGDGSDNYLYGFEGKDVIDGKAGGDHMYGGKGDDTYTVDNANDRVTEYIGEGYDTVLLAANIYDSLPSSVEALTLIGSATTARGNSEANVITGNDLNNEMSGGEGDDVMFGNLGNDRLIGDKGNDRMVGGQGDDFYEVDSPADIVEEQANGGRDTVYASINYVAGADVENVMIGGYTETLSATGNASGNELIGNYGDNRLTGLAGGDLLRGGAGADILDGGTGHDVLDGGVGDDTAVFQGRRADYAVTASGEGMTIIDLRAGRDGDSDFLLNMETLSFSDGTVLASDVRAQAIGAEFRAFVPAGFAGTISGLGTILGTSGLQNIAVGKGVFMLDPSFNRGGDVIRLSGPAADWTAKLSGSSALLTTGESTVTIPVGTSTVLLAFEDGVRAMKLEGWQQNELRLGDVRLGEEFVGLDNAVITTAPTPARDETAAARVFLAGDASIDVSGRYGIFGTDGDDTVRIEGGKITLDPSFNRGGDTLIIAGAQDRDHVSLKLSGSSVIIADADGSDFEVSVPVGSVGITVVLGSNEYQLAYNEQQGIVLFGGTAVGSQMAFG